MEEIVPCEDLKCVQVLIGKDKVKSLTFAQKKQLICSLKPTPDLSICQISKTHKRKFHRSVYKTSWIVGCSHSNKLYCWCCIFFSDEISAWNKAGFNDLTNISGAIKRHANSHKHLCAMVDFSNFGKLRIETSVPRQLSEEISKYNSCVDKNRSVFQRLVDIVCHLAQKELPLRGHDESKSTLTKGKFLELVSLISKYDVGSEKLTQRQQCDEPGPSYLSNNIQNDIVHSVADVMQTCIAYEVRQTKFVSIIIDETPDVSHREQLLCLILRYYYKHEIRDRLLGFLNVSESRTADSLSNIILELLNRHDCTAKLVAQSYDGASVMSGVRNGVQQKVKDVCPQAIHIWCNAHVLALVLSKSCNRIQEVSLFFSALQALCIFFSNSTKRAAFYDTHCSKKLPNALATRWTYMPRVVNTVFEQKSKLIELFSELCDNPQNWDGDTILAAENFENTLRSFNFNFFLFIFHRIFEKTDCLCNILQNSEVDVDYCMKKIKEFQTWLRFEFQSEFDQIYENTLQNNSAPRLRRNVSCAKTEYRQLFVEVIDNINTEITDRYSEMYKLEFFQLLNNKKFENYHLHFPVEEFDSLFASYASYFDKQTLKSQLICLYSSIELTKRNVYELIDFIHENNLEDAFSELLKLAYLVVTIPATSASEERAFSSLKRIHTYLRNTQGQERLSELSMIGIEKQLLVELKRSPTFYSDVIKSFLKKNRRFQLEYK